MNKIDMIGFWVTIATALILVGYYMNWFIGVVIALVLLLMVYGND